MNEMNDRKAMILAAGMGTRLMPRTEHTHKCLTEVNGVPIIRNALENLAQVGVKETAIVVGYLADQVQKSIGETMGGMKISYVENGEFRQTNTSYSMWLGLNHFPQYQYEALFILEGDVFFEADLLQKLMDYPYQNATALEPYHPWLDGTFAKTNEDFFVVDWIHKSQRKEGESLAGKYKTVNLHKFDPDFIANILHPVLDSCVKEQQGKEPLETVMRTIVRNHPQSIKGFDTSGLKWFEIDDENDLRLAEKLFQNSR